MAPPSPDPWSLLRDAAVIVLAHAHPDDETLATGALIAELVASGHEVHVVTATRGERGELMPGVTDVEPGSPAYAAWRESELAAALRALRVEHHAYLGAVAAQSGQSARATGAARVYRDSGMEWIREGLAGPAADSGPDSFTAAPVAEAVDDLAAYLQGVGADVVVTYDAGGGYGHPDHVRMHEVTRRAAQRCDVAMIEVIPPGREVDGDPAAIAWRNLARHLDVVQEALRAHATQVRVDDGEVVHVGGQREPIVTNVGVRVVNSR